MLCGAGTNTLVPAHSRYWVTQEQVNRCDPALRVEVFFSCSRAHMVGPLRAHRAGTWAGHEGLEDHALI
jgi:hypothetical protein